ncbi:hypothetical protein ID866_8790 [Astraeus odoratus]|nr:hypothetical protein ID866_8790 [Astraeus odoratus]
MWMAWDRYQKTGRGFNIKVDFMTGMPSMFSVKKYSDALNALRIERGIGADFQHNLVSVDSSNRKATFKKADGSTIDRAYSILHVTPPMGPLDFIKKSPIADAAGWVEVDQATLRHVKPEFGNIFALGDCSSLPTSKTAAAITSQAPVLTENLYSLMTVGSLSNARYDGYTSCPAQLLTGYGELMLAEFKYGLEPKESFASYLGDQATRRRLFYHFKKDLFPWVYWSHSRDLVWAVGTVQAKLCLEWRWSLTAAQIIGQGDYLDADFDPASLTVSQLLGILAYHNVRFPTPYTKPKLVQLFLDEIKLKATKFRKERLKRENSIASDDGITDGITGQPINGRGTSTRRSRRLPRLEDADGETQQPEPIKRRRSSAQPNLGGTSKGKARAIQPAVMEESEPEEMPARKVSRNKKADASPTAHRISTEPADESGWEDNNIFQSGAESSSPVRPSPTNKSRRKSAIPRKSRHSMSAPPHLSPPSSPPKAPAFQPIQLSPSQSKFEPQLSGVSRQTLSQRQGVPANRVSVECGPVASDQLLHHSPRMQLLRDQGINDAEIRVPEGPITESGKQDAAVSQLIADDPKRKRNIGALGKAMEALLGQERGRRVCAGGLHDQVVISDAHGGEARKWGEEIEALRETMKQKTAPHLLETFDDTFNEAIQQLAQWGSVVFGEDMSGRRYLAHKVPNMTLSCQLIVKVRELWLQWRGTLFGCIAGYCALYFLRRSRAQRQSEGKRVAELVQITLDTLRNQELAHHTDPVTAPQPYLSSIQLRDLILQEEHSISARRRLWDQVERVVESNANVRANLEEVQGGDELRVWRWVGTAGRGPEYRKRVQIEAEKGEELVS